MNWMLIILFLVFIVWSYLMIRGYFKVLDDKIYFKIKIKDFKTLIYKIMTSFASTKFFVILSLFLIIFFRNKLAFSIVFLLIFNGIINETVKMIFKRNRPNIINRLVVERGYSYPSGHTMSATCFYSFLILLVVLSEFSILLKIFFVIFFVFLIIIIGFSRIYLGVHYFSDVIGGFLLGLFYVILYVQLVPTLVSIFFCFS